MDRSLCTYITRQRWFLLTGKCFFLCGPPPCRKVGAGSESIGYRQLPLNREPREGEPRTALPTRIHAARPSAGTKISSRQDARNAKKNEPDTRLSLGDLCVFARDISLLLSRPASCHQNHLEMLFSCCELATQIRQGRAKNCHSRAEPAPDLDRGREAAICHCERSAAISRPQAATEN